MSSPGLVQAVEQAFARLSGGLCELYGLYRSDRRARTLAGDVTGLYNRAVLEERLLRSRLGLELLAPRPLPESPIFAQDLAEVCRRTLDGPVAACRELEEYFGFFKLDGVEDFYHKVRFELFDLQRATQRLLEPQEDPVAPPRRRRPAQDAPRVVVDGRVRQALLACPLYFILDSSLTAFRDPVKLGYEAVNAGVRMLQLRLDGYSTREFVEVALRLKPVCAERDCILVINDRLDVAMLSGADGIHVGDDDPSCSDVRRLAPFLLVGVTARRTRSALEAQQAGADYLGCGSVFPSSTKPGLPLIGTRGIQKIVASVSIPVVGVGGVTLENGATVLEAGAAGICSVAPFRQQRSLRNLVAAFRDLRQPLSGASR
jgi:thiamine-phosphate diphosphorylase